MSQRNPSRARLRTRTGCLICRQHKKKCDEAKPACKRCLASSLECKWPLPEELAEDRRHFKGSRSASLQRTAAQKVAQRSRERSQGSRSCTPSTSTPADQRDFELSTFMDLMIDWAPTTPSSPVDPGDEGQLFEYWYTQFLPTLTHQQSQARYLDFSYMRLMAQQHQPLMDTALACAALSKWHKKTTDANSMNRLREKALSHHTLAVAALRQEIAAGALDGTEDWLLATINGLTLFDSRDPTATPIKSSTHVMATVQLFQAREANKPHGVSPAHEDLNPEISSRLVFERICYESLLYFGTILMLYDDSFDALIGNTVWDMFDRYFYDSPLPHDDARASWPILGIPYRFTRLPVTISRLGRRHSLEKDDLDSASRLLDELQQWSELFEAQGAHVGSMFVCTARIQLRRILLRERQAAGLEAAIRSDFERCLGLVQIIDAESQFTRSLVWPLTIMNAVTRTSEEKQYVRNMIAKALQSTDGGGVRPITEERIEVFLKISDI